MPDFKLRRWYEMPDIGPVDDAELYEAWQELCEKGYNRKMKNAWKFDFSKCFDAFDRTET